MHSINATKPISLQASELKPCPFCGEKPQHNDGGVSVYGRLWWAVWCDNCHIEMIDREVWKHEEDRTILALPEAECFDRWNRRASDGEI